MAAARARSVPRVAAWLAACLGAFAHPAISQVVEPLTAGAVVDSAPAGLVTYDGHVQLVFTRSVFSGPTEVSRGIYAMRSEDGGLTFGAPVVVADAPGVREYSPSLLETLQARALYCYFVSEASGSPRLYWANSTDGVSWNVSPLPLDLGLGPGESVGRSSVAVRGVNDALLAFERRPAGTIGMALLPSFVAADPPQVVAGGVDPALLRHSSGDFLLASRPTDASSVVEVRQSGDGFSWLVPDVLISCPVGAAGPRLLELPRGDVGLFIGVRAGTGLIMRATSSLAPSFGPLSVVPMDPADVASPMPLLDTASNPGVSVYVSRLNADGSSHLARVMTGACDLEPTFAGLQSAVDADPCEVTGIALSWSDAQGWGSAPTGEYRVHRSVRRAFTPDDTTLLATTGALSYLDDTALPDTPYFYAIVAVGQEGCARLADGTTQGLSAGGGIQLEAFDPSSPLPPGEVQDLRLTRTAGVVVARWADEPTAVGYLVSSSSDPRPATFVDVTAAPVLAPYNLPDTTEPLTFYLVRAVNSCGIEGPAVVP